MKDWNQTFCWAAKWSPMRPQVAITDSALPFRSVRQAGAVGRRLIFDVSMLGDELLEALHVLYRIPERDLIMLFGWRTRT
jgi:hypothetical protein